MTSEQGQLQQQQQQRKGLISLYVRICSLGCCTAVVAPSWSHVQRNTYHAYQGGAWGRLLVHRRLTVMLLAPASGWHSGISALRVQSQVVWLHGSQRDAHWCTCCNDETTEFIVASVCRRAPLQGIMQPRPRS